MDHFKISNQTHNNVLVSCVAQVESFAGKLFKCIPSSEGTLTCSKGCSLRIVTLPVIPIREDIFEKFDNILNGLNTEVLHM